jgi:hypothetical protein
MRRPGSAANEATLPRLMHGQDTPKAPAGVPLYEALQVLQGGIDARI